MWYFYFQMSLISKGIHTLLIFAFQILFPAYVLNHKYTQLMLTAVAQTPWLTKQWISPLNLKRRAYIPSLRYISWRYRKTRTWQLAFPPRRMLPLVCSPLSHYLVVLPARQILWILQAKRFAWAFPSACH